MKFEIVGTIEQVETIATGRGVKVRALRRRVHGRGRWRKRKGVVSRRDLAQRFMLGKDIDAEVVHAH